MVPAGFENAGVPGSSPGVAIEEHDERTTALRSTRGAVFVYETSD